MEMSGTLTSSMPNSSKDGRRVSAKCSYHLESYKAALLVSSDKADKLLDNIVNLWFAKFHWSIPVTQSHLYKPFPIPVGPDGFEVLTNEQAQLKKDVIKRLQTVSVRFSYQGII